MAQRKATRMGTKITNKLIRRSHLVNRTSHFFITKFTHVWSVLIFLPIIVFIFRRIHNHYVAVGEQLRINEITEKMTGNVVIVPIAGITKVVEQSINYAETIGDQVIAVYVAFDKESEMQMQEKWKEWKPNVRLVTFISSYRSLMRPIAKLITIIQHKAQEKIISLLY